MKKVFYIFTAAIIMLFFTSCGTQIKAEHVLNELIKPQYTGRLIGTEGNENSARYLADVFKKIGVEPYNDNSFLMPYKQITADPNEQNPSVTIVYEDGNSLQLIHGKDFVTNAVTKDINIDLPIEFDATKASPEVVPVIKIDDMNKLPGFDNEVFVLAQDITTLVVGTPDSDTSFQIRINTQLLDTLKQNKAKRIKISAKYAGKESTLNNVVGIIKGAKGVTKALVLTAHFDHVGKQGDFLFNGAIDNASGVSTLVLTTQKIKDLIKDKTINFDIIIAAVNSEETNKNTGSFEGSKALCNSLAQKYGSVINMNIDCVGYKKSPALAMGVTSTVGDGLITDFQKELTQSNIAFNNVAYPFSDHSSFIDAGYPAFTIGYDVNKSLNILHSANLTAQEIDFNLLEKLSDAIAKYAVSGKGFSAKLPDEKANTKLDFSDFSVKDLARAELAKILNGEKLAFNEHIYFIFQGNPVKATGNEPFYSNEEIHAFFPTVSFPEQIGEYKFESVKIHSYDNFEFEINYFPERFENNKIFTHELSTDNIYFFSASYKNEKNIFLNISIVIGEMITPNIDKYLPLDDIGYKNFKLAPNSNDGSSYYLLHFTKDNYTINAALVQDNMCIDGTKEELVENLVQLFK